MSSEFINIPTDILNGELWEDKSFSKGQAWIDIVLISANRNNGFETTERKLMEHWGWGNNKIRTFLKNLECQSKIKAETKQKQSDEDEKTRKEILKFVSGLLNIWTVDVVQTTNIIQKAHKRA